MKELATPVGVSRVRQLPPAPMGRATHALLLGGALAVLFAGHPTAAQPRPWISTRHFPDKGSSDDVAFGARPRRAARRRAGARGGVIVRARVRGSQVSECVAAGGQTCHAGRTFVGRRDAMRGQTRESRAAGERRTVSRLRLPTHGSHQRMRARERQARDSDSARRILFTALRHPRAPARSLARSQRGPLAFEFSAFRTRSWAA